MYVPVVSFIIGGECSSSEIHQMRCLFRLSRHTEGSNVGEFRVFFRRKWHTSACAAWSTFQTGFAVESKAKRRRFRHICNLGLVKYALNGF